MKTFLTLLFFATSIISSYSQNITIPDVNFKSALLGNSLINTNADSEIQVSEASAFAGLISVSGLGIQDLTGIETFVSLQRLECGSNVLTVLNVTANINLRDLSCESNRLTALNLAANTQLTTLQCGGNQLTTLILNSNYYLNFLDCSYNQLANLNLSGKRYLEYVSCLNNFLGSLDINGDTALAFLYCNGNRLTSLDVSTNISLDQLDLKFNQVANIDVSNNPALTFLDCHENLITDLNVTGATVLNTLDCSNNLLTNLDPSTNTALTYLSASFNQLTNLNASANQALIMLDVIYNRLVNLNFKNGNNTNVYSFSSEGNPNLHCIQVDNSNYSDTAFGWQKDLIASYSSNCTSEIGTDFFVNSSFFIYPNPAHEAFNIELKVDPDNSFLEIIDHLGKKIYYAEFGENLVTIVNILKPGFYFVRVKNGNTSLMKKLIIL